MSDIPPAPTDRLRRILKARRQFAVLDKLRKTIGPGAVLCLVERDIPLSQSVTAVPVGYL